MIFSSPAIYRIFESTSLGKIYRTTLYSQINVLLVPVPHISFSSNVMTFTGTVLALGFGGIFSLLIKRPEMGYRETRGIRQKLHRLFGKFRS